MNSIHINLNLLFNAITGIAKPLIKEKARRNETVIGLLKQFKIDPEHPPGDFSGVYAYTLVEYGVGKPKPILELFRQQEIKAAFCKAFDHNNPSILLSEVDAFVEAYTVGDEIKDLRIDIKREIGAFFILFSQVAIRTRNPADKMMSQQIGSLHTSIKNIQEKLDRIPNFEAICIEIARLATQNYTALPGDVETQQNEDENKCRAVALAQQMRGWFETLGYSFENHEVWAEEYFEFIINIPVRRSFDRILVRGIAGEIGLSDVIALRSSVQEQKTDEGWLVTTRRISKAARDEVKKEENRFLHCYTFDELIDLDADFNGYVNWLEAEIQHRKIDTRYVPLACTKEEISPVTKQRIGVSRYEEEDGWIDGYIDLWLDDPAKEHISILGEFGTGKTWFAFHYAWTALQRYKDAQRRGKMRPRLPVVITLRDFAKALNVENVLAGFFFTQHNIRINSVVFDQLNRMGKLLLIFDGFDEMAAKVDRQQMINNFWELAKVVVPGAKVILTCRTEHFPEAQEGRALLNAELQASTKNLTGETPQFEVLELEKFNDEQIRQVLSYQAEAATVDLVMDNPQLLDLARRPVLTELILEALPDIEAGKPVDMSRVYLYAVRRKMERDIKAERTFTSLADKLYFLCELSWEMLSNEQMSINYKLFPDRIRRLFGSMVQEQNDLDHWHYDMMGQTMLIRNANGDYTPAHRSLLEFFVAYKFVAELGALADDFTELAQAQSCLDVAAVPADYTWSSYFERQLDNSGNCIAIAPLKGFIKESLEKLRENFGRSPLTKAVLDLMLGMVGDNEALVKAIEMTRGRNEEEVGYVGGNAATLTVKVDKGALERRDLSNAVIRKADFSDSSLVEVNFTNSYLTDSNFAQVLGHVLALAFSPQNNLLAVGDKNGIIYFYKVTAAENISILQDRSIYAHSSSVHSLAFSPDGTKLASGSSDNTIKIWDIPTNQCLKTLQEHGNWLNSVSFSPNGEVFASASHDKTIKLWNTSEWNCFSTLSGHKGSVESIAFSPDGKILASGSSDQSIKIWDISSHDACIMTLDNAHTNQVRSIAFSPDGKKFASASYDKSIKIWDITDGKHLKYLRELKGHGDKVYLIVFNPVNSKILASASADRKVKIWDTSDGKCLKTLEDHTSFVRSVSFNAEGKIIASGGHDKSVILWHSQTGKNLNILKGYINSVLSVAFNIDGTVLASGSEDGNIRLWNTASGQCERILQGHKNSIGSVSFSPDGKMLASASYDSTIKLWDLSTGKCQYTFKGHTDWVNSVVFSPDGKILVSGAHEGGGYTANIKVWDIETGNCLHTLTGHDKVVYSVTFSPDGRFLASSSYNGICKLWDTANWECLYTHTEPNSVFRSVAFSSNSNLLAIACEDKKVILWNIETKETQKVLTGGHSGEVFSVAFNYPSELIASGSSDKSIIIWDISTGQCQTPLNGHNGTITSLVFSPQNHILASSSVDETIKLWNIQTGKCLRTLKQDLPYERMNIAGARGLSEGEKSALKALGAVEE